MLERHEHAPSCVYRLADSLGSILAACEDLLGQPVEPIHNILRLELAAITHVLQARRYIEEINVRSRRSSTNAFFSLRARPHSISGISDPVGPRSPSQRQINPSHMTT